MQRASGVGNMAGKRVLDGIELEDTASPDTKRQKVPALASVILEALKVDSLQKLCSSLEPILRRVVSEEVERALAKVAPARIGGRTSPKRLEAPEGRHLQLQFTTRLSLPLFTGGKVEGEHGAAIHVILRDSSTGLVVTSGPESSAKLDIVVLEGDFNNEDEDGWTEEEFESFVVKEREGKRPLLTGELQVNLKEGVGTLGEFTFTDNSSWIRSRKFRLGLRAAKGFFDGVRIREAKTDAFTVKDHRGELYKKHYPPALTDEVWRLEKIGKDGAFHKRLNKASIYTVEDFLRFVIRDPKELRNILGSGMSNKMWEILVEHAKTCMLSGKLYVYYSDDTRSVGAIFNNIYEFCGLMADGQYYSAETLSDGQKVFADALVKKAYDNWMHVVEYDGRDLSKHMARLDAPGAEDGVGLSNYSYDQQVSLPHIQSSFATEQGGHINTSLVGGFVGTGYDHNTAKYTSQALDVAPNAHNQLESTSYTSQDQFAGSSQQPQMTRNDSTGLALGLPRHMSLEVDSPASSQQDSTSISYDDWSTNRDNRVYPDFFSEEEIRARSHEILENEDMQHLLRVFSMGGATPNLPDDGFAFPSYMPTPTPNFNFDEDRGRPGKAVVGWLKIKAAMRWGIFIRKKAAERRAQLVELDD